MGNYDDNKNRKPNIPQFDMMKTGRVQVSVFRMDTGYLVINQDRNTKHSLTDESEISDMLEGISKDSGNKLIEMLAELQPEDYVDLTVVLEARREETVPEPHFEEPTNLDYGQIAAIFNDLREFGMGPTGIRNMRITPEMLSKYFNSPRFIQVTKKTRIVDEVDRGSTGHANRVPGGRQQGKNRPVREDKNKDNEDGDEDAKPHKVE